MFFGGCFLIRVKAPGQIAPEICVVSGEFFTGIEYWPVRSEFGRNFWWTLLEILIWYGLPSIFVCVFLWNQAEL